MKNRYLLALIGGCLLFIGFNLSVTGCGKKGDLVRPGAPEPQQSSPKEPKPD
jgi:predicted small lipoprotein YifL